MSALRLVVLSLCLCLAAAVQDTSDFAPAESGFPVAEKFNVYDSNYRSIQTQNIEVAFPARKAQFEITERNLTSGNEVFKFEFLHIAEVRKNGTFAVRPQSLDDGRWSDLGTQDGGRLDVAFYTTTVWVDHEPVEISMLVFVAMNNTKFSTMFNSSQLERDQVKFALLINNWPFESDDNMLNVTLAATSSKHNDTKFDSDSASLAWAEFGNVDDDDSKVLHIAFEDSVIVDGKRSGNVTVSQGEQDNQVVLTLPHYNHYIYYDPVLTLQSPETTSSSHTTLIIVLCVVGGVILLLCVALIVFFVWRRRRASYEVIE